MSARLLLSAALIVRDEERVLGDCLASLRGVVDQIVVVDTGSIDRSPQIAADHGARVIEHRWTEDFAAARNVALEHARGEWILYIDADERLARADRAEIERRLGEAEEIALRILLRPYVNSTPFYEYRLWRSDPRIRFDGVIHEQVVDAIHAAGGQDRRPVANWDGIELEHVGYAGDQSAKHERNLPLLRRRLAADPSNMFNWCHLGRVLLAQGEADQAEQAFERAVALARSDSVSQFYAATHGSLAWSDLVRLRHERGADVRELLAEGRARWPEQWQLVWLEGQLELEQGSAERAADCFRRLLEVDLDRLPAGGISYDERIFGAFAHAGLGLALFRLGAYAESARAYAAAERLDPGDPQLPIKRSIAEHRAAVAAS